MANNDGANAIQPVSVHAGSVFSRMRIISGSQVVEGISYYGRPVNTLSLLDSPGKQQIDAAEGFGSLPATTVDNRLVPETIAAGGYRKVTCGLLSGLLRQKCWLPLAYCPLTIELEVAGLTDWNSPPYTTGGTTTTPSQNWSLVDPKLFCDVALLDSGLQSQYANHVLQGKHFPISFSSVATQGNPGQQNNFTIAIARGFTRLKGLFASAYQDLSTQDPLLRPINTFYHPNGPNAYNAALDILKVTAQCGSRRFPEYYVSSLSELFYRLRLACGKCNGDETFAITCSQFRNSKCLVAFDFERAATGMGGGGGGRGLHGTVHERRRTFNGRLQGLFFTTTGQAPTQTRLTLHYDAVINLSVSGLEGLD